MRPYETMIIFDAEVADTAVNGVLDRAQELIRSGGGTVGQVDRWGKRTFAYELRKKRDGYYVVVGFSAEPGLSADLDRFLTLADEVLRHKIVRLPDKPVGRTPSTKTPAATPAAADAG